MVVVAPDTVTGAGSELMGVVMAGLALLLALAGTAKLRRPGPATEALRAAGFPAPAVVVRVLSVAELAVGVAGLILPGPVAAVLLGVAFACLGTGAALGGGPAGSVACGCFGDADGPSLRSG